MFKFDWADGKAQHMHDRNTHTHHNDDNDDTKPKTTFVKI